MSQSSKLRLDRATNNEIQLELLERAAVRHQEKIDHHAADLVRMQTKQASRMRELTNLRFRVREAKGGAS